MSPRHKQLNSVGLAAATGLGEWVVRGIKKANRVLHETKGEPLIFTGRFSTPAKVAAWLEAHPDFVARRVLLRPKVAAPAPAVPPAAPAPHAPRPRRAA